ncbi:conserved hypothetical protein [Vibrio mimicus VM573]|nr:conserved hypothetical protein [Vibrio mimicus VM573]
MELLCIDYLGKPLRLEGTMAGWQQLFWNNILVAQRPAQEKHQGDIQHHFQLTQGENVLDCSLELELSWQPFELKYQTKLNGEVVAQGVRSEKDIERQTPYEAPKAERRFSVVGLASLAMKALKSAKMIKVVMASASLAAYSWLFSFQFALALIGCLVFHEYGHVRAMKYFGIENQRDLSRPFSWWPCTQ